ncbi:ATP-grasp domain-containing protein [Candidatus Gottesmanbacteria bacterium]|nr:ATP-grasp domain-containing protein [Candidatus Gottesmanbacteria bacterium]
MKITVLYNIVHSSALPEQGALEEAKLISASLQKAEIFELRQETVKDLKKIKTDIFFNDCDGIGDDIVHEEAVPNLLDKLNFKYTGSSGKALILTNNKIKTKKNFQENKIPTPGNLKFPLIVKPSAQHCSLGISLDSVVSNKIDLEKQTEKIEKEFNQKALVEEYIAGRELNVLILGNEVLPISEIVFGDFFKNKPKIVDFKAKWVENSVNYQQTIGVCPAKLNKAIESKIKKKALKAFKICGGRDYGRVDLRLANDDKFYILEVNLNPDISPGGGAFRSAKTAGYDYPGFLKKIVDLAMERYGNKN